MYACTCFPMLTMQRLAQADRTLVIVNSSGTMEEESHSIREKNHSALASSPFWLYPVMTAFHETMVRSGMLSNKDKARSILPRRASSDTMAFQLDTLRAGILSNTALAVSASPHLPYMLSTELATGTQPPSPSLTAKECTLLPAPPASAAAHDESTFVSVNCVGASLSPTMSRNASTASPKRRARLSPTTMTVHDTASRSGISANRARASASWPDLA
ncbi:hypothetical protein VPH35_085647 [Triticum aestivum]|uniref:Uncharacterized protein n=1 Tax=Triticum urartu TaxID=4572 RepID=A0A8R7ULT0_TRIUA